WLIVMNRLAKIHIRGGVHAALLRYICGDALADGPEICRALDRVGFLPRFRQSREQNADQQCDNPYDDEQFDEGESRLVFIPLITQEGRSFSRSLKPRYLTGGSIDQSL